MGYPVQQSQTTIPLEFLMIDSTDGKTGKTGLTPTVTLSKNGAAFASPAGAVAEIGNGHYKVAGNATDQNTLGVLALHATSAGAQDTDDLFMVVAYNPLDGVHLGLSALPNAAANGIGGLDSAIGEAGTAQAGAATSITLRSGASATNKYYAGQTVEIISGTGAGQSRTIVYYVGSTKVATIAGSWQTNPDNTSVYAIRMGNVPVIDASGDILASVTSSTVLVLASGASASDHIYEGCPLKIIQGTGAGQTRIITGYVGGTQTATVDHAYNPVPDTTSIYRIGLAIEAKTDASLQGTAASVQGNVTGSVASVVGAVGSVTAGVTVTTNNDKTGYTASTVSDKTGYALTTAEHTAISGTDVPAGLTAQGYTATRAGYLDTLNGLVQAIWDKATSALTTAGSIGKLLVDNVNATISSRLASGSYTAPDNADIATILTRVDVATSTRASATDYTTARAAKLDNLDVAISTRMATFSYTAPPTAAAIAAVILLTPAHLLATDVSGNVAANNLPSDYQQRAVAVTLPGAPGGVYDAPAALLAQGVTSARMAHLDADVSTRLATSGYTAPDNADIATILTNVNEVATDTDSLLTGQALQATSAALSTAQTAITEIAADTDTIITNETTINTNVLSRQASGPVTVGTNTDKSGYSLAAAGLNSVLPADPTVNSDANRTANLVTMLTAIYLAQYSKVTATAAPGQETVYNRAGVIIGVLTTSDDGTTFTRNAAS